MTTTRLVALVALVAGCIRPAEELHGGAAPIPSRMADVSFVGVGVAIDGGLQLAHVRLVPRAAADVLLAWVVRDVCVDRRCRVFGRSADSGFLMLFGAIPTSIVGEAIRVSAAHPRHPRCQFVREDSAGVLHDGWGELWGNECLTWTEVRRLRHVE